ncbi:MAG: AMP-binding protein, partial [Rubrivivax sp.]|nr:AMP-binding protein [Rubrivivax sp.]
MAETLARELGTLPHAVIENDIRELKASAELIGEALILGQVREVMQPIASQSGELSSDFAPGLIFARYSLLATLPLKATLVEVFGSYLAAHKVVKADIWAARDAVLAPGDGRAPFHIAVWDSGVDISLFGPQVLREMVDRAVAPFTSIEGRDEDYAVWRDGNMDTPVPCEWVDSTHPSYTLYTSGTTGTPKGVQRDTGGYAVALAASMKHIFMGQPGETFFSTSDIGWVVGHSYIVYGPLIAGMATIMYEGLPTRPDAAVWWSLVEKYKVTAMFSAPTA